jgi:hypothetical protein
MHQDVASSRIAEARCQRSFRSLVDGPGRIPVNPLAFPLVIQGHRMDDDGIVEQILDPCKCFIETVCLQGMGRAGSAHCTQDPCRRE